MGIGTRALLAAGVAAIVGSFAAGGATAYGQAAIGGLPDAAALGATVCGTLGITPAVVKKIFGPGATIRKPGVPRSTPCVLRSGHLVTEVSLGPSPASYLARTVKYELYNLNSYGHASKTPVAGAGKGAVLCTSTSYDRILAPALLFAAAGQVADVSTNVGGVGQSAAVYAEWEALARAIHAHVG